MKIKTDNLKGNRQWHSSLKSARAWRLKMALREVCARAAASNDP